MFFHKYLMDWYQFCKVIHYWSRILFDNIGTSKAWKWKLSLCPLKKWVKKHEVHALPRRGAQSHPSATVMPRDLGLPCHWKSMSNGPHTPLQNPLPGPSCYNSHHLHTTFLNFHTIMIKNNFFNFISTLYFSNNK